MKTTKSTKVNPATAEDLTAKTSKEPKKEKKLEAKTDAANTEAAAQKIQYDRILKWLYPGDCTTAKDRKVFRAKHRGNIRRLEAKALKVGAATPAGIALIAEAKEIRTAVLVDPAIEV